MQMAKRHVKRCSTLLITEEKQIKTTVKYHVTPVRMTIIKNKNKCWWGCRDKRILLQHCCECKLVRSLWKTVWKLLKTLKIELQMTQKSYFWLYSWKNKNMDSKRYKHLCVHSPVFTAALFVIAKVWKLPECPLTYAWTRKSWHVSTYM